MEERVPQRGQTMRHLIGDVSTRDIASSSLAYETVDGTNGRDNDTRFIDSNDHSDVVGNNSGGNGGGGDNLNNSDVIVVSTHTSVANGHFHSVTDNSGGGGGIGDGGGCGRSSGGGDGGGIDDDGIRADRCVGEVMVTVSDIACLVSRALEHCLADDHDDVATVTTTNEHGPVGVEPHDAYSTSFAVPVATVDVSPSSSTTVSGDECSFTVFGSLCTNDNQVEVTDHQPKQPATEETEEAKEEAGKEEEEEEERVVVVVGRRDPRTRHNDGDVLSRWSTLRNGQRLEPTRLFALLENTSGPRASGLGRFAARRWRRLNSRAEEEYHRATVVPNEDRLIRRRWYFFTRPTEARLRRAVLSAVHRWPPDRLVVILSITCPDPTGESLRHVSRLAAAIVEDQPTPTIGYRCVATQSNSLLLFTDYYRRVPLPLTRSFTDNALAQRINGRPDYTYANDNNNSDDENDSDEPDHDHEFPGHDRTRACASRQASSAASSALTYRASDGVDYDDFDVSYEFTAHGFSREQPTGSTCTYETVNLPSSVSSGSNDQQSVVQPWYPPYRGRRRRRYRHRHRVRQQRMTVDPDGVTSDPRYCPRTSRLDQPPQDLEFSDSWVRNLFETALRRAGIQIEACLYPR